MKYISRQWLGMIKIVVRKLFIVVLHLYFLVKTLKCASKRFVNNKLYTLSKRTDGNTKAVLVFRNATYKKNSMRYIEICFWQVLLVLLWLLDDGINACLLEL